MGWAVFIVSPSRNPYNEMEGKIIIRSAIQQDIESILNLYSQYIVGSHTSFEIDVPTQEEFRKRIKGIQEKMPWLACYVNDEFAGYAYASDHRSRSAYQWSKEVSVYVEKKFWKNGVGRGLYTALFEILKQMGVVNVLAGISLPNENSVGFHEKMGMTPVGVYHDIGFKNGSFWDVGWWELRIQETGFVPGKILSMEEIDGSEFWTDAIQKGIWKIKV